MQFAREEIPLLTFFKKIFSTDHSSTQSNLPSNSQHLDTIYRQSPDFQSFHNPLNDDFFLETDQLYEQGFLQLQNLMRTRPSFRFPFGFSHSGPSDLLNPQHDPTNHGSSLGSEREVSDAGREQLSSFSAEVLPFHVSTEFPNWFHQLLRNMFSPTKKNNAKQENDDLVRGKSVNYGKD